MTTLLNINNSKIWKLEEIRLPDDEKRHLEELGLTKGAKIKYLFSAPSGEPRAYLVRGAQLALRAEQSSRIYVRSTEGEAP